MDKVSMTQEKVIPLRARLIENMQIKGQYGICRSSGYFPPTIFACEQDVRPIKG